MSPNTTAMKCHFCQDHRAFICGPKCDPLLLLRMCSNYRLWLPACPYFPTKHSSLNPLSALVSYQLRLLGSPCASKGSIKLSTRIIHMPPSSFDNQKGNRYSDFMVMKTPIKPSRRKGNNQTSQTSFASSQKA